MLQRPRFIPIPIAVLKVYSKSCAIFYGHCVAAGPLMSQEFGEDWSKISAFVGMDEKSARQAFKKLNKYGLVDVDFTPIKPPTEPIVGYARSYIPGLIFVGTDLLAAIGFARAVLLSFICDYTAINGPINASLSFFGWLLNKDVIEIKRTLFSLSYSGFIKLESCHETKKLSIVPTEKAWSYLIWNMATAHTINGGDYKIINDNWYTALGFIKKKRKTNSQ